MTPAAASKKSDFLPRLITGLAMIAAVFLYVFFFRQVGIAFLVLLIQFFIYRELVSIAIKDHGGGEERHLPRFHWFYTYWFFVAIFYMYTRTLQVPLLSSLVSRTSDSLWLDGSPMVDPLDPSALSHAAAKAAAAATHGGVHAPASLVSAGTWLLVRVINYHAPLTFLLYTFGFVAFVLSLRKHRQFRYQFAQFAYCHMALIVVVGQSTLIIANVYAGGLIWFFLPCGLVVCNDTLSYVWGKLLGRTPLIRLSPKKTWEGFIGGGLSTLVWGVLAARLFTSISWAGIDRLMMCPVSEGLGLKTLQVCTTSAVADGLYAQQPLSAWLPEPAFDTLQRLLPVGAADSLTVSRIELHSIALGLVASLVAPFGGFFASGFKRAFKIKDFGSTIPGHGGFTDRMDCQIVMGAFSYIYAHYILRIGTGYHGGQADVLAMLARIVGAVPPSDLALLHSALGCHLVTALGYDPAALSASVAQGACAAAVTGGGGP